jgi:hypothetical protein
VEDEVAVVGHLRFPLYMSALLLKKISIVHHLRSPEPIPIEAGPFGIVADPTPGVDRGPRQRPVHRRGPGRRLLARPAHGDHLRRRPIAVPYPFPGRHAAVRSSAWLSGALSG